MILVGKEENKSDQKDDCEKGNKHFVDNLKHN